MGRASDTTHLKRLFDVGLASLLLAAFSLPIAAIALLIRCGLRYVGD